jgi:membrane associated rhomboid family serine protease
MLVLYFFSYDLESKWGTKRFIYFYMVSAFIGGVFVVFESLFFIPEHYNIPTLGASASIFALTTAFALTFSQRDIYFFFVPIKAKYLIHIDLLIIILSYLSLSNSDISNAAHLGGMFSGVIFIKIPWYKLTYKFKKREKAVNYIKRVK